MRGFMQHHQKLINFLFMDGHVKGLRAVQTFQPKILWNKSKDDPLQDPTSVIDLIEAEYR